MSTRDLAEVGLEAAQVWLAEITDSDWLKDIPAVGWLFKLRDGYISIQDALLISKLQVLIFSLDEVDDKLKSEMLEKLKDNEEIESATEKILYVINSTTDKEKSEIVANLFLAFINKKIDLSDLKRCLDIVDKVFLEDLQNLIISSNKNSHFANRFTPEDLAFSKMTNLIMSPLLKKMRSSMAIQELLVKGKSDMDGEWEAYELTSIGSTFIKANLYGQKLRNQNKS